MKSRKTTDLQVEKKMDKFLKDKSAKKKKVASRKKPITSESTIFDVIKAVRAAGMEIEFILKPNPPKQPEMEAHLL